MYFIDCGAFRGSAIKKAKRLWPKCLVIAFEPNPYMPCNYKDCFMINKKAVWIKDGIMKLYLHKDRPVSSSSTMVKSKSTKKHPIDKKHPVYVETIDLATWLQNIKDKENHVIVKMDIEGAEYAVIERLIKTGSIKIINEMYVEWHWSKMGCSYKKHKALKEKLKKLTKLHGEFELEQINP